MSTILRSGHGMAARSNQFKNMSGADARTIILASREIEPHSSEIKLIKLSNNRVIHLVTVCPRVIKE